MVAMKMFIYLLDITNYLLLGYHEQYLNKSDYCYYQPIKVDVFKKRRENDALTERMIKQIRGKHVQKELQNQYHLSSDESFGYINTSTGEHLSEEDAILLGADFVLLPKSDISEIREAYIEQINDREIKSKLAKNDKHTFANLFEFCGNNRVRFQEWIDFRNAWVKEIARDWCGQNNIRYTDKPKTKN
jgi:hypothetical protein